MSMCFLSAKMLIIWEVYLKRGLFDDFSNPFCAQANAFQILWIAILKLFFKNLSKEILNDKFQAYHNCLLHGGNMTTGSIYNKVHYFFSVTNVPISFLERRKASSMRIGSSFMNLSQSIKHQLHTLPAQFLCKLGLPSCPINLVEWRVQYFSAAVLLPVAKHKSFYGAHPFFIH